jgi:hypothetical protein
MKNQEKKIPGKMKRKLFNQKFSISKDDLMMTASLLMGVFIFVFLISSFIGKIRVGVRDVEMFPVVPGADGDVEASFRFEPSVNLNNLNQSDSFTLSVYLENTGPFNTDQGIDTIAFDLVYDDSLFSLGTISDEQIFSSSGYYNVDTSSETGHIKYSALNMSGVSMIYDSTLKANDAERMVATIQFQVIGSQGNGDFRLAVDTTTTDNTNIITNISGHSQTDITNQNYAPNNGILAYNFGGGTPGENYAYYEIQGRKVGDSTFSNTLDSLATGEQVELRIKLYGTANEEFNEASAIVRYDESQFTHSSGTANPSGQVVSSGTIEDADTSEVGGGRILILYVQSPPNLTMPSGEARFFDLVLTADEVIDSNSMPIALTTDVGDLSLNFMSDDGVNAIDQSGANQSRLTVDFDDPTSTGPCDGVNTGDPGTCSQGTCDNGGECQWLARGEGDCDHDNNCQTGNCVTVDGGPDICCDADEIWDNGCTTAPGSDCGNGIEEPGEDCDDDNTVTEKCDYGETSCTVCNSTCHEVAGDTSYCGDEYTDTGNGEECDGGANCQADCTYTPGMGCEYNLDNDDTIGVQDLLVVLQYWSVRNRNGHNWSEMGSFRMLLGILQHWGTNTSGCQ